MSNVHYAVTQPAPAFSDLTLGAPISNEIARRQFMLSLMVAFLFLAFEAMSYMRPAHADPIAVGHGNCRTVAPIVAPSQAAPAAKHAVSPIRYG
jgi:hypothetical protein